jgi:hypothetical protein
MRYTGRAGRKGSCALEAALFLPWFVFLFIGVFDWGFYARALTCTESAARVAALYASADPNDDARITGSDGGACFYALGALRHSVNVGSGVTTCASYPVIVTATKVTGADSADGQPAVKVDVAYQTNRVIPIPGLLKSQFVIRRIVQMKL